MAKFKITQDDLNRSKVVEPGWYPVEVKDYTESVAKTDGSTNATIEMGILEGPFKGAVLYRLFNEKAPGFIIPFLRALGVDVPEDGGEFDLSATVGRRLRVYVKNEEWQGQIKNRVEDFRPL